MPLRGSSSVIERDLAKVEVVGSNPAFRFCPRSSVGQSNGLLSRGSHVRIVPGVLFYLDRIDNICYYIDTIKGGTYEYY